MRDLIKRIQDDETVTPQQKSLLLLKTSFLVGVLADAIVAVNWLLISVGYRLPNLMSSYLGDGADYRYAMYIATMFMAGWTTLLFWGYFKPVERRDLLILTSFLLLVSIGVESLAFAKASFGFFFGMIRRALLVALFTSSYFYSLKQESRLSQ